VKRGRLPWRALWLDSVAPVIPDLAAAVVDAGRRPLGLLLLGAPRAV
jgi:hypothetical protein